MFTNLRNKIVITFEMWLSAIVLEVVRPLSASQSSEGDCIIFRFFVSVVDMPDERTRVGEVLVGGKEEECGIVITGSGGGTTTRGGKFESRGSEKETN